MTEKDSLLTIGEAVIVALLVYNSRSLNRQECGELVGRLFRRFAPSEREKLRKFFNSFDYHYADVTKAPLMESIHLIFTSILEHKVVTFRYPSRSSRDEYVRRELRPVMITYLKGAFFVLGRKEDGSLRHYRIDRIAELVKTDERFYVQMGKGYFEAGEYHNRAFNMFNGEEKRVRLRIPCGVEEYLRRECPELSVVERSADGSDMIVELRTLGYDGVLFWIFSQQEWIEVLAPEELRTIIRNKLAAMSKLYAT